jgi:hypothetical protein
MHRRQSPAIWLKRAEKFGMTIDQGVLKLIEIWKAAGHPDRHHKRQRRSHLRASSSDARDAHWPSCPTALSNETVRAVPPTYARS